jgi:hypothetical protein
LFPQCGQVEAEAPISLPQDLHLRIFQALSVKLVHIQDKFLTPRQEIISEETDKSPLFS